MLILDWYQWGQSLGEFNDVEFCRKVNMQLKNNNIWDNNNVVELDDEKNLSLKNLIGGENEEGLGEGEQLESVNVLYKVEQIDWDEFFFVGFVGVEVFLFWFLGFDFGFVGFFLVDGQCYVNGQFFLFFFYLFLILE